GGGARGHRARRDGLHHASAADHRRAHCHRRRAVFGDMSTLNETHDPARKSWVASANVSGTEFPIQNLPFGVYEPRGVPRRRVGVAIGDQILDVAAVSSLLDGSAAMAAAACEATHLNDLMALGPPAWSALRLALSRLLSDERGKDGERLRGHLTP